MIQSRSTSCQVGVGQRYLLYRVIPLTLYLDLLGLLLHRGPVDREAARVLAVSLSVPLAIAAVSSTVSLRLTAKQQDPSSLAP